jgi:hypothetical protein
VRKSTSISRVPNENNWKDRIEEEISSLMSGVDELSERLSHNNDRTLTPAVDNRNVTCAHDEELSLIS